MTDEQLFHQELKRITMECRKALQPLINEEIDILSVATRPMYMRPDVHRLELGPWPPEIQVRLDHLHAEAKKIVQKHKEMAGNVATAYSKYQANTPGFWEILGQP